MSHRHCILILIALSIFQGAFGREQRSMQECRLAFLMGMTVFTGDAPNVSIFPSASDASHEAFDRIARLYATDIGVPAADLRSEEWRAKVVVSLAAHYQRAASHRTIEDLFGDSARDAPELMAAYLAGAYSRHGTPTGFRLANQPKGLYLAWLIRMLFVDLPINATLKPGIPGSITIVLRDGSRQTVHDFISEMKAVGIALSRLQ